MVKQVRPAFPKPIRSKGYKKANGLIEEEKQQISIRARIKIIIQLEVEYMHATQLFHIILILFIAIRLGPYMLRFYVARNDAKKRNRSR